MKLDFARRVSSKMATDTTTTAPASAGDLGVNGHNTMPSSEPTSPTVTIQDDDPHHLKPPVTAQVSLARACFAVPFALVGLPLRAPFLLRVVLQLRISPRPLKGPCLLTGNPHVLFAQPMKMVDRADLGEEESGWSLWTQTETCGVPNEKLLKTTMPMAEVLLLISVLLIYLEVAPTDIPAVCSTRLHQACLDEYVRVTMHVQVSTPAINPFSCGPITRFDRAGPLVAHLSTYCRKRILQNMTSCGWSDRVGRFGSSVGGRGGKISCFQTILGWGRPSGMHPL